MEVATHEGRQPLGGPGATPQEAVDFVLSSMAVGRVLNEAGPDIRTAARTDLIKLFTARHVPGEGVLMGCKVWLVTARA